MLSAIVVLETLLANSCSNPAFYKKGDVWMSRDDTPAPEISSILLAAGYSHDSFYSYHIELCCTEFSITATSPREANGRWLILEVFQVSWAEIDGKNRMVYTRLK